jgi:hypothetical protein
MGLNACVILALLAPLASAFSIATFVNTVVPTSSNCPPLVTPRSARRTILFSTTESDETASFTLSEEEWSAVENLVTRADHDAALLEKLVAEALPTMHPRFIIKLRQQKAQQQESPLEGMRQSVATALQAVMDSQLQNGRDVLRVLLNAGEIRKLDAEIGRAARQGQLDAAFFTVLNANMKEAASASSGNDGNATRSQILQHIYTRCQEEVEKNISGGVALLNKLLRTQMDSIRANQLEHYLCPQRNVISSPDGKEITLGGISPVLVPPPEFVDALAGAVRQIRTVEKAGGMDRQAAADMVESCRQVAMEARLVIGKNYGAESDELKLFEDGLMPVFRPESPDSPYIQGQ